MPRFPSAAWMDALCGQIETQEDIGEVADALDGVYRFVIEPAGPVGERHVYDVALRPSGDGGATASLVDGDAPDPRLTLTASYERWRQLITGRLDVGMAIMLRRLRVGGDLSGLVREVSTAKPLMNALRSVDTDWER